ncbi:ribonuclease HIII [Bacillus fonticola]|uniref:ribonuclease HIII n=1 Tax=Bacillus fonticola TaxID=2728853 RepID=UPI001473F31E|nr:ribonuclease HIII [Bacillus fonticola]
MAQAVLQVSKETLQTIKTFYQGAGVLQTSPPPHAVFCAKLPGCTITGYGSGKVLFQGKNAETEAETWGKTANQSPPKKSSSKGDPLPESFSTLSVLGSDEVGTGDYFGPMTVVAAYVSQENIALVKELGVKDSKQLTDDAMRKMASSLIHAVPYSLLVLANPKYNELQRKGMTQGKMKAILHNRALQNVVEKIAPTKPDAILIDQFATREVYYRHLQKERSIVTDDVYFRTKAEELHLSVATASILARVAFLKEMDRLSKQVDVTLPKGAGGKVDEVAARILLKEGEDTLAAMTKWHFANTEKARVLAGKKRR